MSISLSNISFLFYLLLACVRMKIFITDELLNPMSWEYENHV